MSEESESNLSSNQFSDVHRTGTSTTSLELNPYQAPSDLGVVAHATEHNPRVPAGLTVLFLKWLFVCAVSATPSFIIAYGIDESDGSTKVLAMLCAILIFVLGYTIAEKTKYAQALLNKSMVRTTAWIGYGTRILMTVIFPVGFTADMITGMFAISISGALTGWSESDLHGDSNQVFAWYFLTTIIQGILLNIVLFGYMLFVWLIAIAISSATTSTRSKAI